jgi:hypothetical protein
MRRHCHGRPARRVSSLKPPCLPTASARQSHTMLVRRVRSPKQRPRSLAHWRCGRVVASTHRAVRSLARRAATLAKKKVTTLAHQSHVCALDDVAALARAMSARPCVHLLVLRWCCVAFACLAFGWYTNQREHKRERIG